MNGNHHDDLAVGRPFQAVADGLERPSYEELREARLTAYALDQLDGPEKAVVETELAASPAARLEVNGIQALAAQVREASRTMVVPPSETLRAAVKLRLSQPPIQMPPRPASVLHIPPLPHIPTRRSWRTWAALATAICLLAGAVGLYFGDRDRGTQEAGGQVAIGRMGTSEKSPGSVQPQTSEVSETSEVSGIGSKKVPTANRLAIDPPPSKVDGSSDGWRPHVAAPARNAAEHARPAVPESPSRLAVEDTVPAPDKSDSKRIDSPGSPPQVDKPAGPRRALARSSPRGMRHFPAANPGFLGPGVSTGPVYMSTKPPEIAAPPPVEKPKKARDPGASSGLGKFGTGIRAAGAGEGGSSEAASDAKGAGPTHPENGLSKSRPSETHLALPPGMRPDQGKPTDVFKTGRDLAKPRKKGKTPLPVPTDIDVPDEPVPDVVAENEFLPAAKFPYSAFSLEVDRTTYPKVGRFLHAGLLPRPDQVQIEDLVNYFRYDDPQPTGDVPFAVRVEAADCPWGRDHRLVRIAVVAQDLPATGAERGRAAQASSPPLIANDVRVQLEFIPARVASYRLIGYDGPPVAGKKTDGGLATGLGFTAGQTVTALYEVVPAKPSKPAVVDAPTPKAHRTPVRDLTAIDASSALLTVRLRYQRPGAEAYRLLEVPWTDPGQSFDASSRDFRFAAAVAAFGMALRGSQYRGDITVEAIERIADSARGEDRQRAEFVDLVRRARQLGAGR